MAYGVKYRLEFVDDNLKGKKIYTPEQADDLKRKFINAIKHQDPKKFYRSVRRKEDEDQGHR